MRATLLSILGLTLCYVVFNLPSCDTFILNRGITIQQTVPCNHKGERK